MQLRTSGLCLGLLHFTLIDQQATTIDTFFIELCPYKINIYYYFFEDSYCILISKLQNSGKYGHFTADHLCRYICYFLKMKSHFAASLYNYIYIIYLHPLVLRYFKIDFLCRPKLFIPSISGSKNENCCWLSNRYAIQWFVTKQ